MTLFESTDYKVWIQTRIESLPNKGRGQQKKIADHLRTSPTIVTQVLKGQRELTPEQALLLAEFFALSKLETRYLILLVNHSRAGSHRYRQSLEEEMVEMRERAREVSNRVSQDFKMTEEIKAFLYSNWYYLAIWSLTAIEGFGHIEAIANRLGIEKRTVRKAIDFLLKNGLVIQDANGPLQVGPSLIHLESTSPQLPRHHQNWRLQAFRRYEHPRSEDVFYTAPVTLSAADVSRIREKILQFISENVDIIKNSPSEKLYCLCMDWFEV